MGHTQAPWKVSAEGCPYPNARTHIVAFADGAAMGNAVDDSRLIAAAPELLETLKEVQSTILRSKKFNVRKDFHLFNIMAQAVKQAEGGE